MTFDALSPVRTDGLCTAVRVKNVFDLVRNTAQDVKVRSR